MAMLAKEKKKKRDVPGEKEFPHGEREIGTSALIKCNGRDVSQKNGFYYYCVVGVVVSDCLNLIWTERLYGTMAPATPQSRW